MRKFIFTTLVVTATFLIGTLSSCNDEISVQEESNSVALAQINGIANFNSQVNFDQSIEDYENKGVLPTHLQNITTLVNDENLKSAQVEYEEECEDSLICSDILKNFINFNHEIIIEDVYFKITETGTFFTSVKNIDILKELLIDDKLYLNTSPITEALGYFYENFLHRVNTETDIYFFDTFRKIDPLTEQNSPTIASLKSSTANPTYIPYNISWKESNDGRTWAGKTWDKIWGFSKSIRNNFDSKHRVDVKFYAQRFPFYSEIGIKTKTQKKGWTGIWRKQTVPNILNGWEYLHVKEEWDENFFHSNFDPWSHSLPTMRFQNQFGVDMGYGTIKFLGKQFISWNIMGFDIDLKNKDVAKSIWQYGKDNQKIIGKWMNGTLDEKDMTKESIRVIEREKVVKSTESLFAPYFEKKTRTSKATLQMFKSSGGTVGYDLLKGGVAYKNLSAKYTFQSGTILYGAAEKNNKWKGVRLTFK